MNTRSHPVARFASSAGRQSIGVGGTGMQAVEVEKSRLAVASESYRDGN